MKSKIILVLCLVLLPLRSLEARPFFLRDGVMLGSGVIGLFFLGLAGWQSVAKDSRPRTGAGGFLPNYNLSPDSPEAILASKIDDGIRPLTLLNGIRPLPRSYYDDFLDRVGELDEKALPEDGFAREAFSYLTGKNEKLKRQRSFPYLEPAGSAAYYFVSSPNRSIPQVRGSINPFLNLREGRFSEDGHLGIVGGSIRGALTSWLSYELEPEALLASNDSGTQANAKFYLHRGYAKGNIRNFELELGKDTVQWGLGRQGTMMFSGNAEPFYQARVGSSLPVRLPWFLRHLGPTRTDFFLTFLDADREFPHSLLNGLKISFQPHERLELGFSQAVQFGGEGSDSWNPANILADYLTGDRDINRNFSLEARWRIPKIEIEPYAELFWEDCCRTPDILNSRDTLNLVGIYFPNIGMHGRLDLDLEWVRTNPITYRHGLYTSGFFYKGHGIGHPIGPDGMALYGTLRYFHRPTVWGRMVAAFEQRGRIDSPSPENRYRLAFDVHHEIADHLRLAWEAGVERVDRFDFNPAARKNNAMAGLSVEVF